MSLHQYDGCQWVGFDLDHTIARYKIKPLMTLIHNSFIQYLMINYPTIPQDLLATPLDFGFYRRGVVFDHNTGDLISLDENGSVSYAFHGRRKLNESEIVTHYGPPPHRWPEFDALDNEDSKDPKRFFLFTEYFSLGGIFGLALLVEAIDKRLVGDVTSYKDGIGIVFKYFDSAFSWQNFGSNQGSYFPQVRANPDQFLMKRPNLVTFLRELQKAGTKVFLCTNSHHDYTDFLMSYITDIKDWHSIFDVSIVYAQKPAFFFNASKETYTLEKENVHAIGDALPKEAILMSGGNVYVGGNASLFEGTVAYVGDHLQNDFQTALKIGWKGIAVIEDDDPMNADLGILFGERLMHKGSYWRQRVTVKSAAIVNDVLSI